MKAWSLTSIRRCRGASLATYAIVVGLVALGVSVAVSQTGDQVSGLTARVAGSVNAVDGAISGNKGPIYEGAALAGQDVDEFDAMAAIDARGFVDAEGDALSYSLSLSGGLQPEDFTVQQFPDGVVIDGTPGASGTLAVIATDPIGRTATAGPMHITVAPNQPPTFSDAGASLPAVEAGEEIGDIVLGTISDPEIDTLDPVVLTDAGSGQAANFEISGTGTVTLTGTPDTRGTFHLSATWTDEHGASTTAGPWSITVAPDDTSCQTLLETGGSTGSKVYQVDPEDDGTTFPVYCDMTTDGGGWALVANVYANSSPSNTSTPFQLAYSTLVNSGKGTAGLSGNYHMPLNDYRALAHAGNRVETTWWGRSGRPSDPWQLTMRYLDHYLDGTSDFVWHGQLDYALYTGVLYDGKPLTTHDRDRDDWAGGNCADSFNAFGWYSSCHWAHLWSSTPDNGGRGGTATDHGYSNWGPDAAGAYSTWFQLKIMIR